MYSFCLQHCGFANIFYFNNMIFIILQYTVVSFNHCYDYESCDDQFDFPCGGC